jgi:predicted  nucleic acid-binding Zn-ribbon protein
MQSTFEKLQQLQDILSQKFKVQKEIEEIPKRLVTKTEMLNRMKKSYIEKNEQFEKTKERIKKLKFEITDAESHREDSEKKMDMISTQREYESLDKEIKEAADKEQKLRWEIQKEEKRFLEISEIITKEEQMIGSQEVELTEENAKIEHETHQKKEVLGNLEGKEKALVPGMDGEILYKFERIIRNKSGLGIVPVVKGVCTGCHMILPSQFVNEIRAGEDILFCPYCSRILFYKQVEGDDEAVVDDYLDEVGGLADLVDDDDYDDDSMDMEEEE